MLGNAIVLVMILGLAAATALSSTYAMARVSIQRGAERYIQAGFSNGATVMRDSLAQQIAAGQLDPRALPSPMPSMTPVAPTPVCVSNATPCQYRVGESFVFDSVSSTQNNLETDVHVNEARIAGRITVSVLAPDSSVLATRTKTIVFRVTSVPPYVAPAGMRDETAESRTPGDDGGLPPATLSSACSRPAPGSADETLVRAQYYNDASGKCYDGSSWHSIQATPAPDAGW